MGFLIGSTAMIGNVHKIFAELKHKNWEWHIFYNGWIEGRAQLIQEIREGKFEAKSTYNKPLVSVSFRQCSNCANLSTGDCETCNDKLDKWVSNER